MKEISKNDLKSIHDEYIEYFENYIIPKYKGAEKLLEYIKNPDESDFFEAPASSKFHLNIKGGLCLHSLMVADKLKELIGLYNDIKIDEADIYLMALCHDLCKINQYTLDTKNVKIDGEWVQEPFYKYNNDKLCMGHGSESLFIIQKFIPNIPDDVAQAILYHMGSTEATYYNPTGLTALTQNRLVVLLHAADMISTFIDEKYL